MEFVRDAHVWKHHPSFDGMSEDLREAFATPPSPGMIITTEENYKRLKDYT